MKNKIAIITTALVSIFSSKGKVSAVRSSTKENSIATVGIVSALTAGVIGDRIVSNIFSDYSKGKKIAVKFFQNSEFIDFNCHTLDFDKRFKVGDAVNLINPGLKGEKLGRALIGFNKCYFKFWDDYLEYLSNKYFNIALKHKFIAYGSADGFEPIMGITVRVQPGENSELVIRLFTDVKGTFKDVTNEFINDFPSNGKAFILKNLLMAKIL